MKITNHADLPQAIVDAITHDGYSKGDAHISVTGLLRPPRLAVLEKCHEDDIVEDASDRIWSLIGQSIHTILERANRVAVAERRLSIVVEGWKVSGGMDIYEEKGILSDYKVTSVWKLIKGDLSEWEEQLNLYAVILRQHGHEVTKMQIITILRDWSKREAERDAKYPQSQVITIDIPVWEHDKAAAFMKDRVILHKQAQVSLPECTKEDRWAQDDVYAVMKPGRKSAVKLYNNAKDAKIHADCERGLYVTHRVGQSVRCKSYCRVAQFCSQYQNELKSKVPVELEEVS
jgi:hypothetical protein